MHERTNDEWAYELRLSSPGCDAALADLHALILGKLRLLLRRTPSFDTGFAEDVAQESLLMVLAKIDTFRGESCFSSWVLRITINLAYSELRRREHRHVSLDLMEHPDIAFGAELLAGNDDDPATAAAKRALVETLNRTIASSLTDRQRQALVAMMNGKLPMDALARRSGTNRNTLYKLLHDARLRLKHALEEAGYSAGDIAALLK